MNHQDTTETVVLGGGCFWCTESVFSGVRGVVSAVPGYCGGHVEHPSYEQVCTKHTGHIEVVEVRFDPAVVSFETLLRIFFATHDPTTPDRQGGDVGPQYASAIFYQSPQQEAAARRVMQEVQAELGTPVVTHLLPAQRFWPAEQYHRNYYAQHPEQGYCQMVISPKLAKFRKHFAELLA